MAIVNEELRAGLTELRALRTLDLISPSEVVEWAGALLADGMDLNEVTILGAMSDPSAAEVDHTLSDLADGLGLPPVTEAQAGCVAALRPARMLAAGEMTPIEAARAIWRISLLAPAAEPTLRAFVGLASEWDGDPENRRAYDEEIRSECLRLTSAVK